MGSNNSTQPKASLSTLPPELINEIFSYFSVDLNSSICAGLACKVFWQFHLDNQAHRLRLGEAVRSRFTTRDLHPYLTEWMFPTYRYSPCFWKYVPRAIYSNAYGRQESHFTCDRAVRYAPYGDDNDLHSGVYLTHCRCEKHNDIVRAEARVMSLAMKLGIGSRNVSEFLANLLDFTLIAVTYQLAMLYNGSEIWSQSIWIRAILGTSHRTSNE